LTFVQLLSSTLIKPGISLLPLGAAVIGARLRARSTVLISSLLGGEKDALGLLVDAAECAMATLV